MGAADVLYTKAMEYKQKYLNNKQNNKKLFTDSYQDKALNYLREAIKLNHAQAYYELAVIYSSGWNATSTIPQGLYWNANALSYLQKADEFGSMDASYDYALYLLTYGDKNANKPYEQVVKVYNFGRPNDYIPLLEYYLKRKDENNKKIFELLDKHKPANDFLFITWKYALDYVESLFTFGDKEQAIVRAQTLYSNLQFFDENKHASLAELLLKMYKYTKNEVAIRNLLSDMGKAHYGRGLIGPLLKSAHCDLAHIEECINMNMGYTYKDLFDICMHRLVGVGKPLPTTEADLRKLIKVNNNSYGILIYYLGKMWIEGNYINKNEQIGFIYLSVAKTLPESKNKDYTLLGDCYYFGRVTEKDFRKALNIYLEHENPAREVNIAYCYFINQNYAAAGHRYVKIYNKRNSEQREQWLVEGLGYMYFNGKGLTKDFLKAKECFETGIKFNSAYSYNMLGLCCLALGGEMQSRCFELFTTSYKLNEGSHVEYNIGRCYEFGYGVAIDLYKAKEWYELSVAHNYNYSSQRLDEVNAKIKEYEEKQKQIQEEENKKIETSKKQQALKQELYHNTSSTKEHSSSRSRLESLIGLTSVKEEVDELEAQMIDYKRRLDMGLPASAISRHMVFTGNAGTGKTTVARIVAEILKENGIVSKGHLVETDRSGLVGQFIGHTGPKTKKVVESALGGVLFIDEAYALVPKDNDRDFGQEAITTLLKMMEDYKDDLVVIVAGYKKEMKDFIDANPGLKSRFTTYIDFPDYTKEELTEIFKLRAKGEQNIIDEGCFERLDILWDQLVKIENFGNGRAVRNVYEDVIKRRSKRLRLIKNPSIEDMLTITKDDIPESIDIE